jgi:hypothetical protein
MMELQGLYALVMSAFLAATSRKFDRHLSYFLATLLNGRNKMSPAVAVLPFLRHVPPNSGE